MTIAFLIAITLLAIESGLLMLERTRAELAEKLASMRADELERLRTLMRDRFAMTPGTATSSRDLLRVLDMHRPVGVSLRVVVDELQRVLAAKDYP